MGINMGINMHQNRGFAISNAAAGRVAHPSRLLGRGLSLCGCRILRFVKGAGFDLRALRFALAPHTVARGPACRRYRRERSGPKSNRAVLLVLLNRPYLAFCSQNGNTRIQSGCSNSSFVYC
jgi:hypothetical protein